MGSDFNLSNICVFIMLSFKENFRLYNTCIHINSYQNWFIVVRYRRTIILNNLNLPQITQILNLKKLIHKTGIWNWSQQRYIMFLILKIFVLGNKKLWQNNEFLVHYSVFFWSREKFYTSQPLNQAKILGVFKLKHFSKIYI